MNYIIENQPNSFKWYSKLLANRAEQRENEICKKKNHFWSLDFYLPIIDGKCHSYGHWVFDLGLHSAKIIEPGYLKGIFEGCKIALNHIDEPMCAETYKKIHKAACSHFRKGATQTLVSYEAAGKFCPGWECRGNLSSLLLTFEEKPKSPDYDEMIKEIQKSINERTRKIKPEHPPIALLKREAYDQLTLYYRFTKNEAEEFIPALFSQYNKKIQNCSNRDEKIATIADLYQMLEWTHPFFDGQGRTDLIVLATELVKHELSPAILEEPYSSSFCSLPNWTQYLKKGIEKWEKKRAETKPFSPRIQQEKWEKELQNPDAASDWYQTTYPEAYVNDSEDEI
jgi:hypothetical protein